jgi:CheY-like chemotaxis protein
MRLDDLQPPPSGEPERYYSEAAYMPSPFVPSARRVDGEQADEAGGGVLDSVIVVVVDDEVEARDAITNALRGAGALVTPAASAREAFDILEALLPDVLVSDLVMPGLTGCDLMEIVRTDPRTAAIPAVAVTPGKPLEDQEQAYTAGFDFLLGKPVELATLVATVATAAGRGRPTPV